MLYTVTTAVVELTLWHEISEDRYRRRLFNTGSRG